MQVKIRFFTILREKIGQKEKVLCFPEVKKVTIYLVLEALSQIYGRPFVDYVYEEKTHEVKGFLQFLINGKSATSIAGLETQLENNDVLAIVPPVGGG